MNSLRHQTAKFRGILRPATAAMLTGVLLGGLLGGCSNDAAPARSGDTTSPPESAATYDPLQYEQPKWPRVQRAKPTPEEAREALRYIPDAYTYSLRTGFQNPVYGLSCGCGWAEEVTRLAEAGLHAEMRPVRMKILRQSPAFKILPSLYQYGFLVELTRPALTIADASGTTVRREPEQVYQVVVALNASSGYRGWHIVYWEDSRDVPV